ncbi:hypothetical protein FQR65_LT09819 [Abscondita terminalis]|nr:hypothetical protein FQR65_LT09819 [Abscondita terminalis]
MLKSYLNPKLDFIITSAIDKLCSEDDTLVFVYDKFVELELPDVIKNPYVVARSGGRMRLTLKRVNLFVIHLDSQKTLSNTTHALYKITSFNLRFILSAKYLIIINEKGLININDVFEHFRTNTIDKVVVITYYFGNEVSDVKVHTCRFFQKENDIRKVESQQYNQNITIKYVEKYRNIHGRNFSLSVTGISNEHPSFNYFFKLMNELAKTVNGIFIKNWENAKTPPTILIHLNTGLINVFTSNDLFHLAINDPLYFVVKAGREVSAIKTFFIVFRFEVWILIIAAYIITSIAVWFITFIYEAKFKISQFGNPFLTSILGSILSAPKRTNIRCILMCLLIYHIPIRTGFNSNLTTILTTPQFEPGITTLEELAEANIKIYAHLMYQKLFDDYNSLHEMLKTKTKFLQTLSYKNYTDLLIADNSAIFLTDLEIKYLRRHFLRNISINVIDSCGVLKKRLPSFSLTSGHYFVNTLNEFVRTTEESGVAQKYLKEEFDDIKLGPKLKQLVPLNFKHLLGVFLIIIFGLILSTVVFIVEVVIFK